MLWIDEKYISLISNRLPLFKKVRSFNYAFRCPICGDSKKNPYKTRGGFYVPPSATEYNMNCFNCGASMKFSSFLKLTDETLYNEYRLEVFKEKNASNPPPVVQAPKEPQKKFQTLGLYRIEDLQEDHPAVQYVASRCIPREQWYRLYYCPKYVEWVSRIEGKKYKTPEHPRLLIPFFDKRGNISRIAARAFGNEEPRYQYTTFDKDSSRVFGIDEVDLSKTVYVVEGPLDSLFLPNAVAVGTASYNAKELSSIPDKIIVPDNQPRNQSVCEQILKVIERGDRVCIWQEETSKDINQMVLDGMSIEHIVELINRSTFSGALAELQYHQWIKY